MDDHQFACTFCDYEVYSLDLLMFHIGINHGTDKCSLCDFKNSELKILINHIKEQHPEIKCHKCNYSTRFIHTMEEHQRENHTKNKCIFCNYHGCRREMIRHVRYYHTIKVCELCDFKCRNQDDMNYHLVINHEDDEPRNYKCSRCNFVSHSQKNLRIHVTQKHGKSYHCGLCSFIGCSKSDYENHIYVNHQNKLYRCTHDDCHFVTNEYKFFNIHMNSHRYGYIHVCKYEGCYVRCKTSRGLLTHMIVKHKSHGEEYKIDK